MNVKAMKSMEKKSIPVGYGVLHVSEQGKYFVSSLKAVDPTQGSTEVQGETRDLNYPLKTDPSFEQHGPPEYAKNNEGLFVPVLKNTELGKYFLPGYYPDIVMVREWKEFEESDKIACFRDYYVYNCNKATGISITPSFKVFGERLFVLDDGYFWGVFDYDGRSSSYWKDDLYKSKFTEDKLPDAIFSYGGRWNWKGGQKFEGEVFSLISLHTKSRFMSWNSYFAERAQWKQLKKEIENNPFGILDGSRFGSVKPPSIDEQPIIYDGMDHKPSIQPSDDYQIQFEPDHDWKEVGLYKIVLKLNKGKKWVGGTTDDIQFTIEIHPRTNEWTIPPQIDKPIWTEGDLPGIIKVGAKYGEYKIVYDGVSTSVPTEEGKHSAKVIVEGDGTYKGLEKEIEFEIKKSKLSPELLFLQRFKRYVADCGFHYTERDLFRFHTCVKTGMLTLLGGDPGCGKSSLVELYARALIGRTKESCGSDEEVEECFKRIDVNPAWMEPADLIGYAVPNVTDSSEKQEVFHEAQCGLRKFLKEAKPDKPAIVCFEEINLARIELYFSDFVQLISRYEIGEEKKLPSYGGEDGKQKLNINNVTRFVGTFNEDETVKSMSKRFLDRCNVVRLATDHKETKLFSSFGGRLEAFKEEGVSGEEYHAWLRSVDNEVARSIGLKLDELYQKIVCHDSAFSKVIIYPSPRVCAEILRYVINRPRTAAISEDDWIKMAFDEAIAQRIVSKCVPDALNRKNYGEAAERLRDVLSTSQSEGVVLTAAVLDSLQSETNSLYEYADVNG